MCGCTSLCRRCIKIQKSELGRLPRGGRLAGHAKQAMRRYHSRRWRCGRAIRPPRGFGRFDAARPSTWDELLGYFRHRTRMHEVVPPGVRWEQVPRRCGLCLRRYTRRAERRDPARAPRADPRRPSPAPEPDASLAGHLARGDGDRRPALIAAPQGEPESGRREIRERGREGTAVTKGSTVPIPGNRRCRTGL